MADPIRDTDNGGRPDRHPGTETPPRAPRWVKIAGIILGILVLLFLTLQLFGVGGEHGPGRHQPANDPAPAGLTELHTPPAGARG